MHQEKFKCYLAEKFDKVYVGTLNVGTVPTSKRLLREKKCSFSEISAELNESSVHNFTIVPCTLS